MSAYNTQNLPNFGEKPIYGQLPPNDTLHLLQVNDIKVNNSIYALTGPVVVDDDLQVNGIVESLTKTAENITVTGDLTVDGDLVTPGGSVVDRLEALKIQNGYGTVLSANIAQNAQNFLQPIVNPANTTAYKFGFYSITTKEGESYQYLTGTRNSAGAPFTTGTIFNIASTAKSFVGLVFAKMVEEGLLSGYDSIYQYWPAFTGTAYYYQTVTVTNPVTFPYDPSSYSYTTGAFDLSTLTLADCVRYNIGMINDGLAVPPGLLLSQNPAVIAAALQVNQAPLNDPSGLGQILQTFACFQSTVAGFPVGQGTWCYVNGNNTSAAQVNGFWDNYIALFRNKQLIMSYKPQTYSAAVQFPNFARGLPATYDSGYQFLMIVCHRCLLTKGYSGGFMEYLRTKFLTPLGITDVYLGQADSLSLDAQSRLVQTAYRRSPALGLTQVFNPVNPATWAGYGCDPAYAAIAGVAEGPLVYIGSYPNDGFSKVETALNQFNGWNGTVYPNVNAMFASMTELEKIWRFLERRGVAPDGTRLMKTETWNFGTTPMLNSLSTARSLIPYPAGQQYQDYGYGLFASPYNRDLNGITIYGADDRTFRRSGASGISNYFDVNTGNVFMDMESNGALNWDTSEFFFVRNSDRLTSELAIVASKP